jgi:aldehyde:ferredoxin oxidoreductase
MADVMTVDLSSGTVTREPLADGQEMVGGRALTSHIVATEVDPLIDALDPGNVLVYATGVLAGTKFPNGGRLSVGAKSPLTGTIKEANAGGVSARKLARLGLRGVKVTGRADALSVIEVDKDGARVVAAPELKGLGNRETVRQLRERYGDNIGILCMGPAGELLLKAASVTSTTPDFRLRAAARGGLGAVMGSKNLKALVIDDKDAAGVKVADPEALKEATSTMAKGLTEHPVMQALKAQGTPMLVGLAQSWGCLPTHNYRRGAFEEFEAIGGDRIVENMTSRPNGNPTHSCMPGCVVHCSQVYTDEMGNEITSGIEFETLGLLGSNCQISDLDWLARLDGLCDDLGLDTMEIGAAVGVAMDAGLFEWGDAAAVHDLLVKIPSGNENALLLANGCRDTGKALGITRVPQVKGQGMAAWEPRVLKGTGVTYATSPMGADHTAGNAQPAPGSDYDMSSPAGQVQASEGVQSYFTAVDGLGWCLFPCLAAAGSPELLGSLVSAVSAISGARLPDDWLVSYGTSIVKEERDFNRRAGFTSADDRLPAFMVHEALPPTGNRFDVPTSDLDSVFADEVVVS